MPEVIETCPVCSGRTFSAIEELKDGTSYHACAGCGLVLMNPRPTAEELSEYYRRVYWGERTSDSFRQVHWAERVSTDVAAQRRKQATRATHIGRLLSRILPAAGLPLAGIRSVLEIGSGMGETLRHLSVLLTSEGGQPQMYAIEPNEKAREAAADNYGRVEMIGHDIGDITHQPNTFDLIVLSHVLEHLSRPIESLAGVRDHLSERGLFYVEVPNFYGHPSVEFGHNFCFTPTSLRNMLAGAGFRVVELVVTGHQESFPFYIAAAAVAGRKEAEALQQETVDAVRRSRTTAMEEFRNFRVRSPRVI